MARYVPRRDEDTRLRVRLRQLAEQYPRYGYLTLHALLRGEGCVVNRKRTYRLYREEGLQVRTKRRKKLVRPRVPLAMPSGAAERWSLDFMSDQLADGRRFRVLNIVDDFTLLCDNGTEFTSKAMFLWTKAAGTRLHFIQPGKPTQNAIVESFKMFFSDTKVESIRQYLPKFEADGQETASPSNAALAVAVGLRLVNDELYQGAFEDVNLLPKKLLRRRLKLPVTSSPEVSLQPLRSTCP